MSASLERGMNALRQCLDAPTASFFSSCIHCGLCAEACLFYTETGDPRYTPIHRLEPLQRLWRQEYTLLGRLLALIGLSKPITDAEMAEWSPLIFDSCTLCGRCAMVCPMGNDLVYMIRRAREGIAVAGHAPNDLVQATQRNVRIGSAMGVTLETLQAQIRHQEKQTGLPIFIDQPNADYLVLLSSMEIVQFPEYLGALTKIFHHAGVSWTLSSEAFEATNSGIQIGIPDIARNIVMRTVAAAEKLAVKTVICPECGHGFRALRWEGEDLIGRPYAFNVKHILEVLDELNRQGRLPLDHTDKEHRPLTYHDPCQIARRGGVMAQPRSLLRQMADDYREMSDGGTMNWCCGGGGGVSTLEHTEPLRAKVFARKKNQIEELGVHTLVTACANCRMVIESDLESYGMDIEVLGLTEMVADHLAETSPPTIATE